MRLTLLSFVLLVGILQGFTQTQPNILWIITDDHRPDAIE